MRAQENNDNQGDMMSEQDKSMPQTHAEMERYIAYLRVVIASKDAAILALEAKARPADAGGLSNDGKEPDWARYAELEREQLGDADKQTGIYHSDDSPTADPGDLSQVIANLRRMRPEDGDQQSFDVPTAQKYIDEACAALAAAPAQPVPATPTLPGFVAEKVERAIHAALNPKGMHTNGPCYVHIEVTCLQRLLLVAKAAQADKGA